MDNERDAELEARDARIRELEAALAEQQRREEERLAELRQLHERRLRQLRESITYRVGDEVVRAARSPKRALRLPLVLRDLYRNRRTVAATAGGGIELSTVEPRRTTTAAAVLDEFTYRCFAPELALTLLARDAQVPPADFLFVESAWEGNGGDWRYALSQWEQQRPNRLLELIEHFRAQQRPTVFWNKEDPVNFDVFLAAARHFDHVFTTDAATIPWYRRELGHDRVHALPFAAQPQLHNPMGNRRDVLPRVCFAGSWRGEKYERRANDAEILLRPALDLGVLDIFDRQALTPDAFPPPYDAASLGPRTYDETMQAYRQYAAFLNVNSVQNSPTMFSRRVFELLACATPVVSTPAQGITELLGDTVITVETAADTKTAVERLVADRTYRDHTGQRGYRHVMRHHTYSHRVDTMLDAIGLDASGAHASSREPLVTLVCSSMRPEQMHAVLDAWERQTYPAIEFVFVTNAEGFDRDALHERAARLPNARVIHHDPNAALGDCLNAALEGAKGDYFAKWDDDDVYGPDFLADTMLAFGFADAAVVGKTTYYAYLETTDETILREPGREFTAVNRVAGGTIVAERAQLGDLRFRAVPRGTDTTFLQDCREQGLRIFAADRFNYLMIRQAEKGRHTWAVSDREFAREAERVSAGRTIDEIIV